MSDEAFARPKQHHHADHEQGQPHVELVGSSQQLTSAGVLSTLRVVKVTWELFDPSKSHDDQESLRPPHRLNTWDSPHLKFRSPNLEFL